MTRFAVEYLLCKAVLLAGLLSVKTVPPCCWNKIQLSCTKCVYNCSKQFVQTLLIGQPIYLKIKYIFLEFRSNVLHECMELGHGREQSECKPTCNAGVLFESTTGREKLLDKE